MASSQSDPKLLYAIEGINAYIISNGTEQSLTPTGPQTLSILMVPTASGLADPSSVNTEEDFYLHLHLPPELDLPLPATTQIYHQPPTSYLIPRWDLGPDSGTFTRIEFPPVGSRPNVQEDVDTFETIIAQGTSFLERTPAPSSSGSSKRREAERETRSTAAARAKAREAAGEELPPYNPADFGTEQAYAKGAPLSGAGVSSSKHGRVVLVDETDGSVIGEIGEGYNVVEDTGIKPGSKEPVVIALPEEGQHNISVGPAPHEYVGPDMHPAYKKSSLVNKASRASQLLVTTSDYVTRSLQEQADNFTKTTQPVKPVTFTPTTRNNIRRINTLSTQAAGLSSAAVGTVSKYAQNIGANLSKRKDGNARGFDKEGNAVATYKPGALNKSLMAFNTVVDGVEQAGRNLLTGGATSMSTVVGHRWGEEAGEVAAHVGGGFRNVGLVYIDVTGVSRRAILKSVAKGMVVGQVKGGGKVIVGGEGNDNASVVGGPSGQNGNGSIYDGASVSSSRPLKDAAQGPGHSPY